MPIIMSNMYLVANITRKMKRCCMYMHQMRKNKLGAIQLKLITKNSIDMYDRPSRIEEIN